MELFKRLSLKVVSAGLLLCGGTVLLSALGSAALAVPTAAGPEIDPGSICSAITLLLGSSMLVTGRRLLK